MATDATTATGGQRATDDWASMMTPRMPAEDLSFDELIPGYHFGTVQDRRRVFTKVILDEIERRRAAGEREITCLDIGCGKGIGLNKQYQRAVRAHADRFIGIEPDPGIVPEPGLFDGFHTELMERAPIPEGSVDVAYSFMVMEHVADPAGFLAAVQRTLKPGGSYFFMTVNGKHYFTRLAKTLHGLKVDELVLRVLRPKSDEYHYPVAYRANREPQVRAAAGAGWESVDFVYCETDEPSPYLPGPLQVFAKAAAAKRRRGSDPTILLNLLCRLRKGSS